MRRVFLSVLAGVALAIVTQTFVAIAETWSFGPSLKPLSLIFRPFTFPVVTAVSLGVPIALLFYFTAKALRAEEPILLLALVAPFALLQLVGLVASGPNAYAVFYALAFVGMGLAGVLVHRSHQRAQVTSALAPRPGA